MMHPNASSPLSRDCPLKIYYDEKKKEIDLLTLPLARGRMSLGQRSHLSVVFVARPNTITSNIVSSVC